MTDTPSVLAMLIDGILVIESSAPVLTEPPAGSSARRVGDRGYVSVTWHGVHWTERVHVIGADPEPLEGPEATPIPDEDDLDPEPPVPAGKTRTSANIKAHERDLGL